MAAIDETETKACIFQQWGQCAKRTRGWSIHTMGQSVN
jgi:hypothetical protein